MVEQQTREGEVVSLNPAGRVSREFNAKNAATSIETGGRWPVAASLEKKILKNFAIIFEFFSYFHFAECRRGTREILCRVPDMRHSAKKPLP